MRKIYYHEIHVVQLAWLYEVTQKKSFKEVSKHFLELHISNFKKYPELDFKKIKEISTNGCINCDEYGASNLIDDKWSWGKYWSAYKNPEITIKLFKRKALKSVILYGENLHSIMLPMGFYDAGNGKKTHEVTEVLSLEKLSYFKTGKYETYIRKIIFPTQVHIDSLRISFKETSRKKIVALREVQCEIGMDQEFETIQNWIKQRKDEHIYYP